MPVQRLTGWNKRPRDPRQLYSSRHNASPAVYRLELVDPARHNTSPAVYPLEQAAQLEVDARNTSPTVFRLGLEEVPGTPHEDSPAAYRLERCSGVDSVDRQDPAAMSVQRFPAGTLTPPVKLSPYANLPALPGRATASTPPLINTSPPVPPGGDMLVPRLFSGDSMPGVRTRQKGPLPQGLPRGFPAGTLRQAQSVKEANNACLTVHVRTQAGCLRP